MVEDNIYIFWAFLGILFLFLDFRKTSNIKLCLATTSLFCAIVAYKFPQNIVYQLYSFVAFNLLFYAIIKKIFKQEIKDKVKEKSLDNFIGKKVKVIKDIGKTISIDGIGYIEYNNEIWKAKSIDDKEILSGKEVEIVSKENMIMNVKVVK